MTDNDTIYNNSTICHNDILQKAALGVTFGFYCGAGYFKSPEAVLEADRIADASIRWVVITPIVVQEHFHSTVQFRDFELTPSDRELEFIIDYFHKKGVCVQLRPMLETLDGLGRLAVWFPNDSDSRIPGRASRYYSQWFDSMTKRAVYYARLAEEFGCELYCLDSELDRFVGQNNHWKRVVAAVREVYSGLVTSCHTSHTGIVDFDAALANPNHWFYDLDLLSISCYHKAATRPGATLDEMLTAFESERERFRRYAAMYKKPILFGECGCSAQRGSAMNPSGWASGAPYDGDEQANYLSAVLQTFPGEPWWRGLFWWKWDEHNDRPAFRNDPRGDGGFTLWGKPALREFSEWSGKLI